MTEHGMDMAGWQLLAAQGISDDGLTIVGEGRNPRGEPEAWLVRLPALPGGFGLLVPADNAAGLTTNPFFQWEPSVHAESYRIEIDDDPGFGSPVFTAGTGLTSIMPPTDTLTQATRYHWRVLAINKAGQSASPLRSFTTAGNPPQAPLLALPIPDAIVSTPTPEFIWSTAAGATSYTITIDSTDPPRALVFSKQLDTQTGALQRFTLPGGVLAAPGGYTWGVTADNAVGMTPSLPGASAFSFDPPAPCPGDADQSGAVDLDDILFVLDRLGGQTPSPADANADSVIDANDISYVIFRVGPCK